MKNFFLAAVLTLTVFTGALATETSIVNKAVIFSFNKEFKKASEISWVTRGDYAKAVFTMNNEKMEAFYKFNGDWIATSKQIQLDDIPVAAKRIFARRYQDYTVKEAILFTTPEETSYYISANNDKESVILKVDENEQLSLYNRTRQRN